MPSAEEQHTKYDKIEKLLRGFKLSSIAYKRVLSLITAQMDEGLRRDGHHHADIKMFQTYVRSLPNGSESGRFLALDLGGTNFRVLLVDLKGSDINIKCKNFMIPKRIMVGPGNELFDLVADSIGKFVKDNNLNGDRMRLGFTFSFPCMQDTLVSARLSKWTKGFRCNGVVGEDVCRLLHEALHRRTQCDIEVMAIINDTVGVLMSTAHEDRNCEIGLILGTGTNACYVEEVKNVEMWEGDYDLPQQIISTEWGAFGDNGCLDFVRTEFDIQLDNNSINPVRQTFEKMVSGMYLGELVRLVLVRLADENLLFLGTDKECDLFESETFFSKYVSEIESDCDEFFMNTKQVLDEIGIDNYTSEDCKIVKYVCSLISSRAAFLTSAGVSSLLNRIDKPNLTVAVDGSLYRFHPRFHKLMKLKIHELVDKGKRFTLKLSNDGSGVGAAMVAAVATRLQNERTHNHVML